MILSKHAQLFADAAPLHKDDQSADFCIPLILAMMDEGKTNEEIAVDMIDGVAEGMKDIEPIPAGLREPLIHDAIHNLLPRLRASHIHGIAE